MTMAMEGGGRFTWNGLNGFLSKMDLDPDDDDDKVVAAEILHGVGEDEVEADSDSEAWDVEEEPP
jgi:hypothetical protein